jgi:carbon-monoxide dehydrogenase small subunit
MTQLYSVDITVNGVSYRRNVEARLLLSDFLRHELGLTGTHVGCEHGVCGACTILFDGEAARSCLMFAVQADGHNVTTVEGLASLTPTPLPLGEGRGVRGDLHPLQQAFWEAHGLQCGYCTPGILMTLVPFLKQNPDPTEDEIRHALSGNLCRCTGYQHIVDSVKLAAEKMRD